MMEEFKRLILGNVSVAYYAAAEFFALLAILLSLRISSTKRDAQSPKTPEKFSWLFLIWDNARRIFTGQILLFIIFRFSVEFLGRELNMWWAVGIGFLVALGSDRLIAMIKDKFNFLQMDREKLVQKVLPAESKVVDKTTGATIIEAPKADDKPKP